jgi:hypothetical protein
VFFRSFFWSLIAFGFATPALAQSRAERLHFDLPALDVRENAVVGFWPSMRQSQAITRDAYYLVHGAIYTLPYPKEFPKLLVDISDILLIAGADTVIAFVPFGEGWMHEEWHRAVMSRRDIGSYNDVYDFPIFKDLVAVSHVKDDDLIRLKRNHPADQVRMSSAGIEGDLALANALDKDRFFYGTRAGTTFLEWMTIGNAILYMNSAAFDSNGPTAELEEEDGTDVEARDFTGLDPNGWVYDLFRPDEPYEARGVHPTGIGIDRYRSESDLSPREQRFLEQQAKLSWINLANPNLIGFYDFKLGELGGDPFYFNASLNHVMAPFGYSIGANLFAKAGRTHAYAELRAFVNDSLVLPGLRVELVRYPLGFLDATLSPRVSAWLQPKDQRFFADSASPGGAVELRLNLPLHGSIDVYAEASAKSAGWMVGDVFLEESLNLRTGIEAFAF